MAAVTLAVITALVVLAPPAQARTSTSVPRRGCTTSLIYERSGTDINGPFTDRVYEQVCGARRCSVYYTSRDGVTWRLVATYCSSARIVRRI